MLGWFKRVEKLEAEIAEYRKLIAAQSDTIARWLASERERSVAAARVADVRLARIDVQRIFDARVNVGTRLDGHPDLFAVTAALRDPMLAAALNLCDALRELSPESLGYYSREVDALLALRGLLLIKQTPLGRAVDEVFSSEGAG